MKKTISVSIENTNNVLFKGDVNAITSFNEKGTFDILPFHTHFITIIKNRIILHQIDGKKQEFPIDGGILRVLRNNVDIFLGIEVITV